jgi:hypothetical protein
MNIDAKVAENHRVERVLGFRLQSFELGLPAPLPPAGKCVPSPFGSGGGGGNILACGREGVGGGPNSDDGTDTVVL